MESSEIDGRRVAYERFGPPDAPRRALLMHGFPDEPGSLRPLASRLVAAGFHVVTPAMPGYAESAPLPTAGPHRVAAHLVGLCRALGWSSWHVVGHDWGAVAGYTMANLEPQAVRALAALSVPPPGVFARNLLRQPAQLVRSRYMLQFQVPAASERFVRRDDLAFIDTLWRRWSPGYSAPPERLAAVKAALSAPGALTAALAYYRSLLDPRAWREAREIVFRRVAVPTLVLAGADDRCIAPTMFTGLATAFAGPFDFIALPGAGHFLPLEATEDVAAHVLAFFDRHAP